MKEPSDQESRDYKININKLISHTEQRREAIYAELLAVTAQVFVPDVMPLTTANSLLSDYFDQHPVPDDAPWQEKAIRAMASLVNAEMMLEIERRHGSYLGDDNQEDPKPNGWGGVDGARP